MMGVSAKCRPGETVFYFHKVKSVYFAQCALLALLFFLSHSQFFSPHILKLTVYLQLQREKESVLHTDERKEMS